MDHEELSRGVSVVVPALNEAETIGAVLESVKGYGEEVLVIDGHSSDDTVRIARDLGVPCHRDGGKGKGDAIRCALRLAAHPIVVFIDADGSHEPADIPRLVEPIWRREADLVIGSRLAGGSDELSSDIYELVRLTGSILINLCINYRWNCRLSDIQNGFRALRREVGLRLDLSSDNTAIEQEMVMKALHLGYRVLNVASHEYRRKGGESKIIVSKVWPSYVLSLVKHVMGPSRKGHGREL